jgi:hypothetical protein
LHKPTFRLLGLYHNVCCVGLLSLLDTAEDATKAWKEASAAAVDECKSGRVAYPRRACPSSMPPGSKESRAIRGVSSTSRCAVLVAPVGRPNRLLAGSTSSLAHGGARRLTRTVLVERREVFVIGFLYLDHGRHRADALAVAQLISVQSGGESIQGARRLGSGPHCEANM